MTIGIAVIAWLFAALIIIHTYIVLEEYKNLDFFSALSQGISGMAEEPLAIFPLPSGCGKALFWSALAAAGIWYVVYYNITHNAIYNRDTVHGDSRWLEGAELALYNKQNTFPKGKAIADDPRNIILAYGFYLAMDNEWTRRNLNVLIIGGSGSGKSFNYVTPNALQAACNYFFTDPSGELYSSLGRYFEFYGYRVLCLNLDNMKKSGHYNPFNYIHSETDVARMATAIVANTTDGDTPGGDSQFWIDTMKVLLNALFAYLEFHADPQQRTFESVMNMILAADVDENDASKKSRLDEMFDSLAVTAPESYAVKQYQAFKKAAGKTLKSVLIQCESRLFTFFLKDVTNLTGTDDIHLERIGDEPTAFFLIIPETDSTFRYLSSMVYTQLFAVIYGYCKNTAVYSQNLVDASGRVIRSFRAGDRDDSIRVRQQAQEMLDSFRKGGSVTYNDRFGWWEVRAPGGFLITHRGSEKEAQTARDMIKRGRIESNTKQSHHGARLPIHVRGIMDEFRSTGKIPGFMEILNTCRKFSLSLDIILQSLAQLQMMYEKEWSSVPQNCDNLLYLGGGADEVTAEWLSKMTGMETRRTKSVSESYHSGGSSTMSETGEALFSMAQFRTLGGMGRNECVVIPSGLMPFKGEKYPAMKHPGYGLMKKLNSTGSGEEDFIEEGYVFDPGKNKYLADEYIKPLTESGSRPGHGSIQPETDDEALRRRRMNELKKQQAESYENNRGSDGRPVVSDAVPLGPSQSTETEPLPQEDIKKEFADKAGGGQESIENRARVIIDTTTGWWDVAEQGLKAQYAGRPSQGNRSGRAAG